jgi:hypothetical protein
MAATPRRYRLVVALARLCVLALVEIQVAQLLVVAGRRVLLHECFEVLDSLAPSEAFKRVPEQPEVRHNLHQDVDERARRSEEDDDPEPERIRTPANEVQNRQHLQQDSPLEELKQPHRARL